MEITKISSKGQIVIPESVRVDIEIGTPFIVSKQGDLIILKKVNKLTNEEIKEIKELEEIWRDIDEGKAVTLSKENFLDDMKNW